MIFDDAVAAAEGAARRKRDVGDPVVGRGRHRGPGHPPAELTFMAKRAGAHITELNAGHLSMIAEPETVAQVMEQAAKATS